MYLPLCQFSKKNLIRYVLGKVSNFDLIFYVIRSVTESGFRESWKSRNPGPESRISGLGIKGLGTSRFRDWWVGIGIFGTDQITSIGHFPISILSLWTLQDTIFAWNLFFKEWKILKSTANVTWLGFRRSRKSRNPGPESRLSGLGIIGLGTSGFRDLMIGPESRSPEFQECALVPTL